MPFCKEHFISWSGFLDFVKRGKAKKKSMWLPSSVHKYCRNLQMAALLPN